MRHVVRLLTVGVLLAVLDGCASTGGPDARTSAWLEMEQSRQARLDVMAAQCQTDLCLVMVAQEQGRGAIRQPQTAYHPAWNIVDRALSVAIPAYFGSRQVRDLAGVITDTTAVVASIDRADHSVTIGGDQIGRDRIDDRSVSVGGDQIGRDRIDDRSVGRDQIGRDRIDDRSVGRDQIGRDQRIGDEIEGSCVGDECRNNSPGSIDQSDNSDNSTDNSPIDPDPLP